MTRHFYTYAFLRKDGTPYYIGKGQGKRAFAKHGRHIGVPPKERVLFLKTNLTEEEAHRHEIYMIALYGRKDLGTGILRNLTNGGEGMSGHIPTDEVREKIKKLRWISNGVKQKRWGEGSIPEGWSFGRLPVKWITNGLENKMISKRKETPEGWREGRVGGNPTEGKKWINNGRDNKLILPGENVPDGWVKGLLK